MVKYIKRTYTVEITHRVELPDECCPETDHERHEMDTRIVTHVAPDYEKSPLTEIRNDLEGGNRLGFTHVSLSDIDVEKTGESITGKGGENDPNVAIYAALDAREMELGI